jgi:hypothetical protein
MPERTTEDYEGLASMKVQKAIYAILAEDPKRNYPNSIADKFQ